MTGAPSALELNVATAHEAIAATVPDRECMVWRERRYTWADTTARTRSLARFLVLHGIGRRVDGEVDPWVSPHDQVALYLTNCPEYLEGMLAAYKARAAPININYRYVRAELAYVLHDADARAVIVHSRFAPLLAEVLGDLQRDVLVIQVGDESGNDLLTGAFDYDDIIASTSADQLDGIEPSPDDQYIVYTGGTTGMPKGVLWRQADFLVGAAGVRRSDGDEYTSLAELCDVAARRNPRTCPAPPLMHGAAHWNAISVWMSGGTVVMQDDTLRFDAHDVLRTIERERVTMLNIVGDAFARPLVEALTERPYDLSALRHIVSGGAVFSGGVKRELAARLPLVRITDAIGTSESGRQAEAVGHDVASFAPAPATVVLSDDRTRVLAPGDTELGWLAKRGRVPLGYLGDPVKTAATFPVVEGERYVVAGDRARLRADGRVELLGRESATINTGGEKVFAEEVELAIKQHPDVYDALVVGRASERWGQEVIAVVHIIDGRNPTDEALQAAAGESVARFKLPKAIVRVDAIQRSASGKPDYTWARGIAAVHADTDGNEMSARPTASGR